MPYEIVGEITEGETIAVGRRIRDLQRLRRLYGKGPWRKPKGVAVVRLRTGTIRRAELHCYEAHGIGRKEIKRKRYVDENPQAAQAKVTCESSTRAARTTYTQRNGLPPLTCRAAFEAPSFVERRSFSPHNNMLERPAGSPSLAAAAPHER